MNTINKHMPIKFIMLNKYKVKKSDWITHGILRSIRYRDKLYKMLKLTSPDSPDYPHKKQNFLTYRAILGKCIRNCIRYDNLSNKLLKTLRPILVSPVTIVINQSLNSGIFPDKLKLAKVIPIHKKDKKEDVENYRPISLLPAISKIFEKVVFNQLYEYFSTNNLFFQHQYGFRKKHSTNHAIL